MRYFSTSTSAASGVSWQKNEMKTTSNLGCVSHLRFEGPSVPNITLQHLGAKFGIDGFVLESMDIDNVFRDTQIGPWVAFVENHEKQIKSTHDWRAHLNVSSQRPFAIIPPSDGVCGGENGCPCIECCVYASLGYGDGLLFHGFVNGHLVGYVHLVEFVDSTDTIVR